MARLRRSLALLIPLSLAAACSPELAPTAPGAEARPAAAAAGPVCVFFNVPALGAVFGAPAAHVPGQFVFAENGVRVTVQKFLWTGGGTTFNHAEIVASPLAGFGSGKVANTNNINLGFDFSGIGFVPTTVVFDWLDYGGNENLRVNTSGLYAGELILAPTPWGGAAVSHSWFAVAGGKQGRTKLSGPVKYFWTGGQEFYLDNVCAYP